MRSVRIQLTHYSNEFIYEDRRFNCSHSIYSLIYKKKPAIYDIFFTNIDDYKFIILFNSKHEKSSERYTTFTITI